MRPVLEVARMSKRYRRVRALNEVDLSLNAGDLVGLVGPNGAGKTTLLRVCAGLARPSGGVVRLGISRAGLRYFAGERTLPPNVRVRTWRRFWLPHVSARAPLGQRIGELSRGTRQRLGLETTMACGGGTVWLLDEPWEGLDPDAARWLSAELMAARAAGAAILVSSHRIHELAAICDRCEFLVRGAIVDPAVRWSTPCPHEARVGHLLEAYDRARRMP